MKVNVLEQEGKIKTVTINIGGDVTQFKMKKEMVEEIPIFGNRTQAMIDLVIENKNEISSIISRGKIDLIVVCTSSFFDEVIRKTPNHQLDVNYKVTKTKVMMRYTTIGCDPCTLLVTARK